MYGDFCKLLDDATGVSEHVIVINLDIRGFSSFCKDADSLNVATYIKRVYSKILNDYFKEMSFFKPTGDGLIMTFPYNSKNLAQIADKVIATCLNLNNEFSTLVQKDAMINFDTPKHSGIGVSRGSACCIKSGDKILDYSGRVLNLASRLMDMARPSGVVIDESFKIEILEEDKIKLFGDEQVFVRGISTKKPITVHYTIKDTVIPEEYKNAPKEPKFKKKIKKIKYCNLKEMKKAVYIVTLDNKPIDPNKIVLRLVYPDPKLPDFNASFLFYPNVNCFNIEQLGNDSSIRINVNHVLSLLEDERLDDNSELRFEVTYPV